MKRTTRILLAGVLLLTACGDGSTASSQTVETTVLQPPSESSSSSSTTSTPSAGEGGVPADFVSAVVADAAERASVDVAAVEVVEAISVEWPDGSLGCPQPGMMYTQVITPGYRIIVAVGDETFDYRLGQRGNFRLCESSALDARDPDLTVPTIPGDPDE